MGVDLTTLTAHPCKTGLYADVYELDNFIVRISTDQAVLNNTRLNVTIKNRGHYANQISQHWRNRFKFAILSTVNVPVEIQSRTAIIPKASRIPMDVSVYGHVCGPLAKTLNLTESLTALHEPLAIFTSNDRILSKSVLLQQFGTSLTHDMLNKSLNLYWHAAEACRTRGLTLAMSRFRWGQHQNGLIPIGELLTPNNSTYWPHFKSGPDYDLIQMNDDLVVPESLLTYLASRHKDVHTKLTTPCAPTVYIS